MPSKNSIQTWDSGLILRESVSLVVGFCNIVRQRDL